MATPERNPSLPNVPTTTEAGLPAFEGLRPGTRSSRPRAPLSPRSSPEIVAKLNASAAKALDDETVKKRLLELGSVIPAPAGRTPQALGALVKNEVAKWSSVLKPATN